MPLRARRYMGRSVISSPFRRTRPESGRARPNDNIEGSGLTGAVRAKQPDDFTLSDLQLDVVNDFAPTVGLAKVDGLGVSAFRTNRRIVGRSVISRLGVSSTSANHFLSRR